ncbi:MAG: uroporphyrinogen decarboxylase family protein [Nitrososphaerales archaeon]
MVYMQTYNKYKTRPEDSMSPYERMITILDWHKEKIDRLPATNVITTYTIEGMEIFDAYWPDAHKDPVKMAKLGAALHELAGLENVEIPFELTLEAEALGIKLEFFEGKIKWPSVKEYWVKKVDQLDIPRKAEEMRQRGRVPVVCKALQILRERYYGKVPIIANIDYPFQAIGGYIVDTSTWYKYMRTEPEEAHRFMSTLVPLFDEIACAYLDSGADVVTIREEASSLANIHPKTFREFVMPYLKKSIEKIKTHGHVILHTCGECWSPSVENVSNLIACGADAFTVEEATPMIEVRRIANKVMGPWYPIGGNLSAFKVLHEGPIEKIRDRVKRVIDAGCDMPMAGCDIWLETPTRHIKAFVEAVIEFGTPPPWHEEGVEKWLPKELRGT